MKTRNIFWWGLFFSCGILLQTQLPGVDMLAPGLIIALQERRFNQTLWIFLICILIQEGIGTLDFGAAFLWYISITFLFFIGRWLFETANIFFVFLLSACMGVTHYVILQAMSTLQYIPVDQPVLLEESSLQGLLVPFIWIVASLTRRWVVPHENTP